MGPGAQASPPQPTLASLARVPITRLLRLAGLYLYMLLVENRSISLRAAGALTCKSGLSALPVLKNTCSAARKDEIC